MPRKSVKQNKKCYVHNDIKSWHNIDEIREKVCNSSLPLTKHNDENYYCIFHFPSKDKDIIKFTSLINERIEEIDALINEIAVLSEEKLFINNNKPRYDFRYIFFPSEFSFIERKFGSNITFSSATFVSNALFSSVTFMGEADFSSTTFMGDTYFSWAKFEDENTKIYFHHTKFNGTLDFYNTTLKGYIKFFCNKNDSMFIGEKSFISLQEAIIEDVKRFSFDSVRLQPSWFIRTDAKKFQFYDCKWKYPNGQIVTAKEELKSLGKRDENFNDVNELLTIACRQLAINSEDNNDYQRASLFRKIGMESKRLKRHSRFNVFSLYWWYWLSSYYGESWKQAMIVLLVILFLSTFLYTQVSFLNCPANKLVSQSIQEKLCEGNERLSWGEATRYSLATATFQNIEYRKPVTGWGESWVIIEKILAPLQAALLALAIRRKFMR